MPFEDDAASRKAFANSFKVRRRKIADPAVGHVVHLQPAEFRTSFHPQFQIHRCGRRSSLSIFYKTQCRANTHSQRG